VHQEVAFFDVQETGELCSRLSTDVALLNDLVTYDVANRVGSLLTVIICTTYLFFLSPMLSAVMFATFPLVFIVSRRYGDWFEKLSKSTQDELAGGSAVAYEALVNIRTVKAFSREEDACQRYDAKVSEAYRVGVEMAHARGKYRSTTTMLDGIANAAVLWVGAFEVLTGHMTPGDLTTFTIFAAQISSNAGELFGLFAGVSTALGATQRVFQLIDRPPLISPSGGIVLPEFRGKVELRGVSFAYGSRPNSHVLRNLSLTLEPGTVTALVGGSGGGKSTVASLIMRFYDPNKGGTVFIDGVPLPGSS
jgi:ABC-type multidrug transport system fused ATPase/permease subunit